MSSAQDYEELKSAYQAQEVTIKKYEAQLEKFQQTIINLQKHIYGSRNEKLLKLLDDNQESFDFGNLKEPIIEEEEQEEVTSHKRGKKKAKPKDVEIEEIIIEPEEANCSCCGKELVKIGEERTKQLEYILASFKQKIYIKIKKACSSCKSDGVSTGKLPAGVPFISGSELSPSLLSRIIVSKYEDPLPLYRQERIYKECLGLDLARQRLCDWVGYGANLLEPVTKRILKLIKEDDYIHGDKTTLKVQDLNKPNKLHQGYLWGALGPPGVYFKYSASRDKESANDIFKDSEGYLHLDFVCRV